MPSTKKKLFSKIVFSCFRVKSDDLSVLRYINHIKYISLEHILVANHNFEHGFCYLHNSHVLF